MKFFGNIFVLLIFLNFLALPSIAEIFDIDIPKTNIVLSEEETSSVSVTISEKVMPKTLNIQDFIKFFEPSELKKTFISTNEGQHISPYLSIISPPPEC